MDFDDFLRVIELPDNPQMKQDQCVEVWVNELRLSDFNESGGWAAIGRVNANLADFADVSFSGNYSTPTLPVYYFVYILIDYIHTIRQQNTQQSRIVGDYLHNISRQSNNIRNLLTRWLEIIDSNELQTFVSLLM